MKYTEEQLKRALAMTQKERAKSIIRGLNAFLDNKLWCYKNTDGNWITANFNHCPIVSIERGLLIDSLEMVGYNLVCKQAKK